MRSAISDINDPDLTHLTGISAVRYPNVTAIETPNWTDVGPKRREAAVAWFALATIRRLEQWLVDHERLVHGPLHSSIGEEAVAVGACLSLTRTDQITSTHRAHHHVIAKILVDIAGATFDPLVDDPSDQLVEAVRRTCAEILGLRNGWAGGRGGSMHLAQHQHGVLGTSAIVGGGIPIAVGAALAARLRATGSVAAAFFGDGAASIGAFHEGIALARAWNLPALFILENNLYSVATTVRETIGFSEPVIRAAGYDMPGLVVDGMDVWAVQLAVGAARQHALSGKGPVLIEARTYRHFHQHGVLRGSAFGYRTKEEEEHWRSKDPIACFPVQAEQLGLLTRSEVDRIAAISEGLVHDAISELIQASSGEVQLNDLLQPDPTDASRGVLGAVVGVADEAAMDRDSWNGPEVSFVQAISQVIGRALERDSNVFVMGEEVGHMRGGAYGATADALKADAGRVLSTPICENGFAGAALGAALVGMKPIVELMYPDFALEGADQLFNHIAKARYMYGGDDPVSIIVRARTAQGRGFGPQHSSDPAALFGLFPGWRIAAPSSPGDYVGVFNAALATADPVLIVEHWRLWTMKGRLASDDRDYAFPIGRARLVRRGGSVTVIAWSHALHRVLALADELASDGVEIEVIDPIWLDRSTFDMRCVEGSVERTGGLVVVEDASRSHSMGAQIADWLYPSVFRFLRAPITRVTGKDVPTPVSGVLEEEVLLSDGDIKLGIRQATMPLGNR